MTSFVVFTLIVGTVIGCSLAKQTCTCTCLLEEYQNTTTPPEYRNTTTTPEYQNTTTTSEYQNTSTTPTYQNTSTIRQCDKSITTASGPKAPVGDICAGALIFEDNFDNLDLTKWQHENSLAGGGNWEFQWYTNNQTNSYTEDGVIYFRPTLLADEFGEEFLSSGTIDLNENSPYGKCTNSLFFGCKRSGSRNNYLNPIKSARLHTINSFSFLYGRVEINAQLPTGDWLWPALWFMPKREKYGLWPASGEINMMESRGNLNLVRNGVNIGTEQIGSTLHFGPNAMSNGYETSTFSHNSAPGIGFHSGFHRYQMEWTPNYIKFSVDDVEIVTIPSGFWERGGFAKKTPGIKNPWRSGSVMAPFDHEFYLIMNLAVGGIAYFPDDASNPGGKPWSNKSPQALTDFWNGRDQWLPTWNLNDNHSKAVSFKVDYARIWAL